MSPAGREILSQWREAGEWWNGEPYRELTRCVDERGVVQELLKELPSLGLAPAVRHQEIREDHTEEPSLRVRRSFRSEKNRKSEVGHPYVPLHCFSGYAIGRSSLLASELPYAAASLGLPAMAIADSFSLVGAAEFSKSAERVGIKPLIGASFEMEEGGELVLIAKSKRGYQSLSQLISACHLNEPRLYPLCNWGRLESFSRDLICLTGGDLGPINRLLVRRRFDESKRALLRLRSIYGPDNLFAEIEKSFLPWEIAVNGHLMSLAKELGIAVVAGGAIGLRNRFDYPVQDILTCVETLCMVEEIHGRKPTRDEAQKQIECRPERWLNAERFLRSKSQATKLFSKELLNESLNVSERCDDHVLPGMTRLPKLYENEGEVLRAVTFEGASERCGTLSHKHKNRIEMELARIAKLDFSSHFLTIHDICQWSRREKILFSGRGSVVDSAVSYCLGISRIDAFHHDLHFDRFLPADGSKRPDIDVDFEAHRRDDVRNYVVRKYGEDRVATVSAIGTYGTRGIIREVGKAMGLPEECIGFLAKRIHGGVSPEWLEDALERRPELRDSRIPKERFRWVFRLAAAMADMPRNIRSHSSGVVISDRPIAETVPVMLSAVDGVRIIQWDKRSAKRCFDKFDILCLRGQDVLKGVQERIAIYDPLFDVEDVSLDDQDAYRTMRSGQLIGIPQSASPAMRQAHIRLRTEDLHDASLVQAGIRPGVGGAVKINELIARRRGLREAAEMETVTKTEQMPGENTPLVTFDPEAPDMSPHPHQP